MRPDSPVLLQDMLGACAEIQQAADGMTFTDYCRDRVLRAAVERWLILRGEAAYQLRKDDPEVALTLPHIDLVVRFRHILVHGYAVVRDGVMWGFVEHHLAQMAHQLETLLSEPSSED